jgi:peptidoglycan hydrolase-like protein with peptidoglycan-binding domain
MNGATAARLTPDSTSHDTVNDRVVEIYFQKSPGKPRSDTRGIEGLEYRVMAGGRQIQSGRTGADGKIEMTVRGSESTLQLMFNGSPVAEYRVTISDDALEAVTNLRGQQLRLRMLGYQLGHWGDDGTGVDGMLGRLTERSILDFQADHGLLIDGVAGQNTRNRLVSETGA